VVTIVRDRGRTIGEMRRGTREELCARSKYRREIEFSVNESVRGSESGPTPHQKKEEVHERRLDPKKNKVRGLLSAVFSLFRETAA